MTFCLGIDTGGTYTDAVIVDDEKQIVLESVKSLTTYPDPIGGIRNALDLLPPDLLSKVTVVSVSTTLSTNTVLENTGEPAALILIGDEKLLFSEDISKTVENFVIVRGGHDGDGNEVAELDTAAIESYVRAVKDKVSAFAVSSYFSIRNPSHELKAKELIIRLTSKNDGEEGGGSGESGDGSGESGSSSGESGSGGEHGKEAYPVVCGHELAQSLGAGERGMTAYLNAMLLPVTKRFVGAIVSEIDRRGLEAEIKILKCNGAVSGITEAMEKPVESIFSGPAASLLGASFLSGQKTCLMIDVGGTSTDISFIEDGFPDITEQGAVVGGRRTKVRAIRMETSALGGDSQIWIRAPSLTDTAVSDKFMFGPRRIIPLCRAAALYPSVLESLKERWFSDSGRFTEYIQPIRFFIRSGYPVSQTSNLTPEERMVYNKIKDTPVSVNDIAWDMKYIPGDILESLVRRKAVDMIGFTPTDVLHVLGEYESDCESNCESDCESDNENEKFDNENEKFDNENEKFDNVNEKFNKEASVLGARILASFSDIDTTELCRYLKQAFASKIAQELIYFVMSKSLDDNSENIAALTHSDSDIYNARTRFETAVDPALPASSVFRDSVKAMLSFKKPLMRYKLNTPVVMIGGPVKAFAGDLSRLIDAEIITPEFCDVGNAVGSLAGKIVRRVDIAVRNVVPGQKRSSKNSGFIVYFPGGRRAFSDRDEALEYARELGKQMILDYMAREKVPADKIEFKMYEEDIAISKNSLPVMTKLVFEGFARNVF
ncbi:MAG: hydantoinase/oxoprolinase family protein [Methanimicrococcus sp.]|nr:hydantoinase/oxoprolinase family protein [Methanimicrococcus sp.]